MNGSGQQTLRLVRRRSGLGPAVNSSRLLALLIRDDAVRGSVVTI